MICFCRLMMLALVEYPASGYDRYRVYQSITLLYHMSL
jgi:hypothetical protein